MREPTTSNVPSDEPQPTGAQILEMVAKTVEDAWQWQLCIGHMRGVPVYLNRARRELTMGDVTFSVDHPYLVGTKMHASALRVLAKET